MNRWLSGIGELWVMNMPRSNGIPYAGTDGRLEWFTQWAYAIEFQKFMQTERHINLEIEHLADRTAILNRIGLYLHNGFIYTRLNNGRPDMMEIKLEKLLDYREPTLLEEKNRVLRNFLIRSRQCEIQYMALSKEEKAAKIGRGISEFLLMTRYNAYREIWQGVLYALTDPQDPNREAASVKALERILNWQRSQPGWGSYGPEGIFHGGQQGGLILRDPLSLFYVNRPGEQGVAEKGSICVFTDYRAAQAAQKMFRDYGMNCSIVMMCGEEIAQESMKCDGFLVDMAEIGYRIPKAGLGELAQFGSLDAPILVTAKEPEKEEKA
ncbi:MAG: hypothetical protein IJM90_06335 [Firmicutes bacterium]|nr:hypothetical protein [Bacillota bacterium]